jgi:hypothetical protein
MRGPSPAAVLAAAVILTGTAAASAVAASAVAASTGAASTGAASTGSASTGSASTGSGRGFVLGRANGETSAAALSDSRGTPLSLSAPKNKAPLAVSRNVMVRNLNAQYVGGLSAGSLKLTGGSGFSPPNADIALLHNQGRVVAETGRLPAGTYYVTATALIDLTTGDYLGQCALYDPDFVGGDIGGSEGTNYVQAAEAMTVHLTASGAIEEDCYVSGTGDGSEAIDAGITAIRIVT